MDTGIIIVNKPQDFTSRDVVNKISKILKTKKVGHTGTLDPLATGVLVICVGKATKLCDILTAEYKEYIATIKLGIKTDTLDITGKVIEEKTFNVTKEQIKTTLDSFLGTSIQTVPIYSAVKVKGKKLYEYARNNEPVELPKRQITIKDIALLNFKKDEITFKTTVSKGTYIRALIDDICKKMKTVGSMSSLTRTKQGNFMIEDAYTLEQIEKGEFQIIPLEAVLHNFEKINLDQKDFEKVKNGAIIDKKFSGDIACFYFENKVIALYQTYEKNNKLAKPLKMF